MVDKIKFSNDVRSLFRWQLIHNPNLLQGGQGTDPQECAQVQDKVLL